ncbi:MAG: DUF1569 domain-containing protein [Bacteroidota bacterium]
MFKKIIVVLLVVLIGGYIYSHHAMKVTQPDFMDGYVAEIEEKIAFRDAHSPEVSKADVAWHLDHMLKTVNEICKALEASDPQKFEGSINLMRTMSLSLNYIPRGRAKSPSVVRPPEVIVTEDLYSQLETAKQQLSTVFELDEKAHFKHPVFGTIARGNALRFIEVHTKHHLKIVRDIIEAQ